MNSKRLSPLKIAPGEATMARAITWAAAAIALVVGLAGPGAYLWLSWRAQLQDVAITARLHATFVTQAITQSASDWQRDVLGLLDADLVPQPLPELRRIVDLDGRVVTGNASDMHWPEISARALLATAAGPVGHVVIARSMWPVIQTTGLVALISLALAIAIYATLRVLPLRALGRAMAALAAEQERSRRDLEQYVDVLFQQAVDGILVFEADGTVRSCNPQAATMLGVPASAIVGHPLAHWIDVPHDSATSGIPAVGTIETMAQRRKSNVVIAFPCELTVSVLPVAGRESGFVGTLRDVTDRRQTEQQMMKLANFDALTGLPNRSLFRDRLGQAMQRADRSQRQMILIFLDLDRFKNVNDSLGHDVGDQLLRHVADALTAALRSTDSVARATPTLDGFTVSRLGGDEFTIIAENLDGVDQATQIAQRIQQALRAPFHCGSEEIVITTSMGVTLYPQDHCSGDDLLKHADMAMYRSKEMGRNGYQFYDEAMNAAAARRLQLESQLRHGLERNEFKLVYQPKADLHSGKVTGVEVLLRWQREGEAMTFPDVFIPVLEETGLILPVGQWVLEQAARQVRNWQAAGLPALRLAVNLSARQLRQGEIVETVAATLAATGLPAAQLELELTESMLMDGESHADTLRCLSKLGVQLAIDDFGTGYSSLSYLRHFCVDTLKIDRSFVRDTPDDAEGSAITTAVIALGRSLNLRVVAEGVETQAQMDFLRQRGCDEMQGYFLSRPLNPDAFVSWWRTRLDEQNYCKFERIGCESARMLCEQSLTSPPMTPA